jgi:hypothetical protein
MGRACIMHAKERKYIQMFGGRARKGETTRKPRTLMGDNIKANLKRDGVEWTGFIWLGIEIIYGLLYTQ